MKPKKPALLSLWTQLKPKLTKLSYLNKNKSLIKDALETYLNQSSSFLSTHHAKDNRVPLDWKITPLTEPTIPKYDLETQRIREEWTEYYEKKKVKCFC
jgi:hypothetical protein